MTGLDNGPTLTEVVDAVDAGEWLFNREAAVLVDAMRDALDLLHAGEVDDAERLLEQARVVGITPEQGALPT